MEIQRERESLREMKCGTNLAYILSDAGNFKETEYKVIQNQTGDYLIKCVKMLYNGNIQLYYQPGQSRPLSEQLPAINEDRLLRIVRSLLEAVEKVRNNGFLHCGKLIVSSDKIYIDMADLKVKLIYLPVKEKKSNTEFEWLLRRMLLQIMEQSGYGTSEIRKLEEELKDQTISLREIYERTCGKEMVLVGLNTPEPVKIPIMKEEFLLGKKASEVDGVLDFSRQISRKHCKVNFLDNEFTITDMNSSNGTKLNGERIVSGRPYLLKDGDIIRIAGADFQVRIQ